MIPLCRHRRNHGDLRLCIAFLLLHTAALLHAQTASDLKEGLRISRDPGSGACTIAWWGKKRARLLPANLGDPHGR